MAKSFYARYLAIAIALERDINAILAELRTQMAAEVKKQGGTIKDQAELEKALTEAINEFWVFVMAALVDANVKVAQVKVDEALQEVVPLLRSARLNDEVRKLKTQLNNYPEEMRKYIRTRTWSDKVNTPTRIKTLAKGNARTVRQIISQGMKDGKSALQIAKDIESYVMPTPNGKVVRPYDLYRKEFGKPKSYTPKKGFPVPSGSVQYNAVRIARTETARTYREASMAFYDNKPYIKGFRWVLSNSHPKPDVCDEYAVRSYERKGDVPLGHPNCLCDVQPIVMSSVEMSEAFGTPLLTVDRRNVILTSPDGRIKVNA